MISSCWHKLLVNATQGRPDLANYALYANPDNHVVCRKIPPSGPTDEPFLWAWIGGALTSKATGMVLEASAEVRKQVFVKSSARHLRPTQSWRMMDDGVIASSNGRMLVVGDNIEPGCVDVLGFETAVDKRSCVCRWKCDNVPRHNVVRRPVCPPPKVPNRMTAQTPPPVTTSTTTTTTTVSTDSGVPSDDEIDLRQLLFEPVFCSNNNDCYKGMDKDLLKTEWEKNGIKNGNWGSPVFDVKYYLENSEIVRNAVAPGDYEGALNYFLYHCQEVPQTSKFFNFEVYREEYPDLRGYTPKQLFYHFFHRGYDEKRLLRFRV